MTDPKLYLGIDNCFAYKRWTLPDEWMRVIHELGLKYVEASADTELDPLYMGPEHTKRWIEIAREECGKWDIVIKNVYSGHGTYATAGIAHWAEEVRRRFIDDWMKAQIDTANAFSAGFGFFAHGFDEMYLQSHELYMRKLDELYDSLAEIAAYAKETGMNYCGLEQMYTPHMPPWTIDGTKTLLGEVSARAGAPFYTTVDLGHMNGQQFFLKPCEADILRLIVQARAGTPQKRVWMGTEKAMRIYRAACSGEMDAQAAAAQILADAEANPHLFAQPVDGDIWAWVRALGCYSPIIHLQQSDGKSSPHWPFSENYNRIGVVSGEKLIASLAEAYAQPDDSAMPPACGEITLTLEPFLGTAGNTYDMLDELHESVAYWRRFVPKDGMRLSEAAQLLK